MLRMWLGTGLVVAILATAVYVQTLRLNHVQEQRDSAQAQARDAKETIAELHGLQRAHDEQRAALAAQTQDLERELNQRLSQIRSLQDANEALRGWAVSPLPPLVVRMRQRPAITGAEAYREHLRDTGSLPPAGEQSEDPRGPEPAGGDH
ncbi:MAG: hypothetical protein JJU06_13185 [Ectothiorhodospiraceae bacterium]|nr:hypothetical protein [Ectothiorhodospiraceae bacterium]